MFETVCGEWPGDVDCEQVWAESPLGTVGVPSGGNKTCFMAALEAAAGQTDASVIAGMCEAAAGGAPCEEDEPSSCGDGSCDGSETEALCPVDCAITECGNGICEFDEDSETCVEDCPVAECGNGLCEDSETDLTCEEDCGPNSCGDGVCGKLETIFNCQEDCIAVAAPFCGDDLQR